METAEKQHAKRVEQTLASINKNLERIAKSLEKMVEPKVYKLPKFDLPLDIQDVKEPVPDQYLRMITAEEPAAEDEKIFKSNTPDYWPDYWRDCLSDTFKP